MLQARDEHGRLVRNPKPPALSRMVANLGRGHAFVIVERVDDEADGDWYVQVRLRDDNTYQLEFRDGTAAEHYQTRRISQENGAVSKHCLDRARVGCAELLRHPGLATA
ncbi:hypothetical protein ACE1OC_40710 [Streptomyces sp. DSM 116496]|uniref:hypothetical protein n=1 Tax=Streptomyces stoeckheimensis TaxID=3344656 RepID=UPI0038B3B3BA